MKSLELLEQLNKILIEANDLYNTQQNMETAFNVAINKLRKLNQEQKTPIYYKRAKKNEGEVIIINKWEKK